LSAIGLWTLNQHNGTRQLKDIVGTRGSPALLRLTKRLNDELNYRSEKPEIFQLMKGQLNSFEPVHVADFLK
jgi:intein-encoded DNA endonuclease-like protein